MKYWWMSYIGLYGNRVTVVGPWPHDDNVSPFNEWKRFRKASSNGEFIVFPATTTNSNAAVAVASKIWDTPELKEDFLQTNISRTSTPQIIKSNLTKSSNEEAQAATVYRTRKATADPVTAKLYEHIAGEEDGHRAEFNKRLTELDTDKAKIKYNALGGYMV